MTFENLIVEIEGGVALIRLNRPQALNALNTAMLTDLANALNAMETDDAVRCVVLTGSDRAFAAGADIKEMSEKSYADMFKLNFFTFAARAIEQFRKPIIAAVSGFALGGGCELAMLCDFIIASETAKFGQPEINLGVAPGIGGSQRLTRFVGKSKAMDMVLTARQMGAGEAERSGLVSRVVPVDKLIDEAMAAARKIAALSPLAVMINKELVNQAYETTLSAGVAYERRAFQSLFAFEDQSEGMAAFVGKRPADFKGK
jgi:enoyl-CoA hydratase/carnithine racemase